MNRYRGICKYCGKVRRILAESQHAADEEASKDCTCSGAKPEEPKVRLMVDIDFIVRKNENKILSRLSEERVKMPKHAGCAIVDGIIDKATFDFGGFETTIQSTEEQYKTRAETQKMIEEKTQFVRAIERCLRTDKQNNVDRVKYVFDMQSDNEDCYDEYIDIIFKDGMKRLLLVTGYGNGAILKAVIKEVY